MTVYTFSDPTSPGYGMVTSLPTDDRKQWRTTIYENIQNALNILKSPNRQLESLR